MESERSEEMNSTLCPYCGGPLVPLSQNGATYYMWVCGMCAATLSLDINGEPFWRNGEKVQVPFRIDKDGCATIVDG